MDHRTPRAQHRSVTTARDRRAAVVAAAAPQGGVISRAMLRSLGVDRNVVSREISADRWQLHGRQTVAVHQRELTQEALRWRALWEVGPGAAVLDGVSALAAAGVRGFEEPLVHVPVPRSVHPKPVPGVRIHRVARLQQELHPTGIPRTRPGVAAVRAAAWALSTGRRRCCCPSRSNTGWSGGTISPWAADVFAVRRRRALITRLARDIACGAQSLGELDFAAFCRRRGLPEPDRQAVRRTATGRVYLDVRWSGLGLVVEFDGSGHRAGLAVAHDNLRQNAVTIGGDTVLRIDLVGLRLFTEAFLDQVCAAHALLAAATAA